MISPADRGSLSRGRLQGNGGAGSVAARASRWRLSQARPSRYPFRGGVREIRGSLISLGFFCANVICESRAPVWHDLAGGRAEPFVGAATASEGGSIAPSPLADRRPLLARPPAPLAREWRWRVEQLGALALDFVTNEATYQSLLTKGNLMALSNAERQRRFIARLKARAAQVPAAPVTNEPGEAREPRALTSAEQDQILNLVIQLLKTVDHSHEKKFYKYYVSNSLQGVLLPSCSHRGWKGGGFRIDNHLLTRLWAAITTRAGCQISSRSAGPPWRVTLRGALRVHYRRPIL